MLPGAWRCFVTLHSTDHLLKYGAIYSQSLLMFILISFMLTLFILFIYSVGVCNVTYVVYGAAPLLRG